MAVDCMFGEYVSPIVLGFYGVVIQGQMFVKAVLIIDPTVGVYFMEVVCVFDGVKLITKHVKPIYNKMIKNYIYKSIT